MFFIVNVIVKEQYSNLAQYYPQKKKKKAVSSDYMQ